MSEQLVLAGVAGSHRVSGKTLVKRRKRFRRDGHWEISDHSCKHCMGRLLRRQLVDGTETHRCCECGASEPGDHTKLCWCGVEVRGHGRVFECYRNREQSDATPHEVLVRERVLGAWEKYKESQDG